jgi:folate-binding protein YgfZ
MGAQANSFAAELTRFGVLCATGAEARAFLHGQLTSDIEHLAPGRARRAGWCSAKGRLLATLLVVPHEDGYLLQLARDLAPAVAKRLSMFILRARVKLADETGSWRQFGVWGAGAAARLSGLGMKAPESDLELSAASGRIAVRVAPDRYLVFGRDDLGADTSEDDWLLQDIRAGIPHVAQATQDQFVPQMVNFEQVGALDFQKGCYPGQEVVARAQYRGQVKRRMARVRSAAPLAPGQELFSHGDAVGTVVSVAGDEALAVLQISTLEAKAALHAKDGAALEVLSLPYPLS